MFDWTKDASGHAQMLLLRPGFLSFQKTPLQIDKMFFMSFNFILFFVRFLNCLDLLSNTIFQWIFIESIPEATDGVRDG